MAYDRWAETLIFETARDLSHQVADRYQLKVRTRARLQDYLGNPLRTWIPFRVVGRGFDLDFEITDRDRSLSILVIPKVLGVRVVPILLAICYLLLKIRVRGEPLGLSALDLDNLGDARLKCERYRQAIMDRSSEALEQVRAHRFRSSLVFLEQQIPPMESAPNNP